MQMTLRFHLSVNIDWQVALQAGPNVTVEQPVWPLRTPNGADQTHTWTLEALSPGYWSAAVKILSAHDYNFDGSCCGVAWSGIERGAWTIYPSGAFPFDEASGADLQVQGVVVGEAVQLTAVVVGGEPWLEGTRYEADFVPGQWGYHKGAVPARPSGQATQDGLFELPDGGETLAAVRAYWSLQLPLPGGPTNEYPHYWLGGELGCKNLTLHRSGANLTIEQRRCPTNSLEQATQGMPTPSLAPLLALGCALLLRISRRR